MEKLYEKIVETDDKLQKLVQELESNLKDKIEFEFYIVRQTDGWMIGDYGMGNAMLSLVLDVIEDEGYLTYEKYLTLCI